VKLLFFGSPQFAVPSLRALHGEGHRIEAVVTQPDRPRGRSGRPAPTPVKRAALELGLDVHQPPSANDADAVGALREAGAELGVVVAYGEILTAELLAVTARGFINAHASLLPDYRGAAPVNWAVIRGEEVTGVSVIRMEPQLDAGPVLATRRVSIGEDETAGELHDRLAPLAAEALTEVVGRMDAGEDIAGRPQPERTGFFARKLTKQDGRLDWSLPAAQLRDRVRGLTPWPGAFSELNTAGDRARATLLRVETAETDAARGEPGTVLRADDAEGLLVQAGRGAVRIRELRPAGGRAMTARDFIHGHRVEPGDRFE